MGFPGAHLAECTPACDGERVFITFPNSGAVTASAVDLAGKILWQTKLCDYQIHQGYAASPIPHGPNVLVSADHKGGGAVAALDRVSGKIVWSKPRPPAPNYCSPVVLKAAGKEQLILMGCDVVSSLEAGDLKGKKIGTQWRVTRAAVDAFLAS